MKRTYYNDEILNTNYVAPFSSMVSKNLHDHHLKLLARHVDYLFVLIIPFQQRREAEPVRSSV
jgi:hypothetical protein